MLYYNSNYKCPICNKYINCTVIDVPTCINSMFNVTNAECDNCLHSNNDENSIKNLKSICQCTNHDYITHINMLNSNLLESNSYDDRK